ncbi:hypothetical protein BU16DRAFT_564203 [Lophium mytilinum]|uniref:Uncharacterized protein n=1 Tax=Lophium mytilinum TaxID=390894 RepID=A0A6A6QKB3_9PEZI|nr:hypothetical protein BU16DRAFT_564203 [Lophium mytilinum]
MVPDVPSTVLAFTWRKARHWLSRLVGWVGVVVILMWVYGGVCLGPSLPNFNPTALAQAVGALLSTPTPPTEPQRVPSPLQPSSTIRSLFGDLQQPQPAPLLVLFITAEALPGPSASQNGLPPLITPPSTSTLVLRLASLPYCRYIENPRTSLPAASALFWNLSHLPLPPLPPTTPPTEPSTADSLSTRLP